eukprot:gnl/TRDRNA2_/TRDRNA2_172049_c3_seq2.p1 gnl/TRDRNA2_/TRDRNA2_172049_c3~~gnl/TRDRNA2_/TRDRNA2_172049_c3_seq2.p1  ORF type:complete len:356 (+),score=79.87 gnl/TRDRNA2_/TRDRNA2_172049_c3_seq2:145-1068(+)
MVAVDHVEQVEAAWAAQKKDMKELKAASEELQELKELVEAKEEREKLRREKDRQELQDLEQQRDKLRAAARRPPPALLPVEPEYASGFGRGRAAPVQPALRDVHDMEQARSPRAPSWADEEMNARPGDGAAEIFSALQRAHRRRVSWGLIALMSHDPQSQARIFRDVSPAPSRQLLGGYTTSPSPSPRHASRSPSVRSTRSGGGGSVAATLDRLARARSVLQGPLQGGYPIEPLPQQYTRTTSRSPPRFGREKQFFADGSDAGSDAEDARLQAQLEDMGRAVARISPPRASFAAQLRQASPVSATTS